MSKIVITTDQEHFDRITQRLNGSPIGEHCTLITETGESAYCWDYNGDSLIITIATITAQREEECNRPSIIKSILARFLSETETDNIYLFIHSRDLYEDATLPPGMENRELYSSLSTGTVIACRFHHNGEVWYRIDRTRFDDDYLKNLIGIFPNQ